jgi:hypothetical protein
MIKELAKIRNFAKLNKVEINFNGSEIALLADIGSAELTCKNIKPENVQEAVAAIVACRKNGWKSE